MNTSGASTPRMMGWKLSMDQREFLNTFGRISTKAWVPSQMMLPSAG